MKFFLSLLLLFSFIAGFSQDSYIDSLIYVIKNMKEDTNKVKILNEISWETYIIGDFDNSILYAGKAKALSQKLNYNKGLSEAYAFAGHSLYNKGLYPQAIESYMAGLKIEEKYGNKKAISNFYSNIGNVYDSQEKFDEALKFNLRALKIRQELNDTTFLIKSYHNIALVYINKNKLELAIKNLNTALDLMGQNKDSSIVASCYHNLGIVYSSKKDFKTALEYAQRAFKIREILGNEPALLKSYINLSSDYEALGMYKEAEFFGLKAIELARKGGFYEGIMPVANTLSKIYTKKLQYEKALAYHKEYSDARDSIISEENSAKTLLAAVNYEFEKKEMTTRLEHDKKEAIAEAVSKKQQIIIWAVSGLFLLAIVISILIVRQNKFRAEQRSMQLEQRLLRSQMNPHFIFNSLIAIESFIYKNEPREAGKYLSGFARLMRLILENSREEFVPLEKEIQTLEYYLKLQKLRYDDAFDYTINIEEGIDNSIEIPPMLAQPFIENAIEHGLKGLNKKGEISISFFLKNEELVFEVLDNGIGFSAEKTVNKENGHRSLAITITKDRLKNLNKKNRNIKLVMENMRDSFNSISGAKVTFVVPFTKG